MQSSPDGRKTALVTGGARGIGRAIAEELIEDHNLCLLYCATEPDWASEHILTIQGDLRAPETAPDAIEKGIARFGRLDVIVNNAGVVASSPLDEFDLDGGRALFDVNALAPHALLAAALPHLHPGAAVVNISSVNAELPPMGASLYGASKAALQLWTRGAAKELGPRGIRVNAVAPGAIDIADAPRSEDLRQAFIGMTALGRMGRPEDIAAAVRFLVSDSAAFITGETLTVSGGYRL
jgi:NAD(P)-dependent dehydrogenase (short-subunit alcohol dehydrogenase family)